MENIKKDLNAFLVGAFQSILKTEENYFARGKFKNLSVKEMHLIDAVVKLKENNIAKRIARELNITQSSLTTAVSTLEKKGMLIRKQDEKDKRVVKICVTELAMEAYEHHRQFHKDMVEAVMNSLDEQELNILVKSLDKITAFFNAKK